MPPSPSLRRSPRSEPRGDVHKRGRSLRSGLSFKERDDDLVLFNELQSREKESFLLQSTDDFEDIFSSKPKSFPDLKLGINIPVRGESSDLLNGDGDKNDYEWLITPPETPLFRSLDDEPPPVNLVHSGRARSRPIPITRSSTMEKSQRSSRGSPSPQRMSLSPRSGSSTYQGRPSSTPRSSPIALQSSPPPRRSSPPPVKPSTPPRSRTPTSRRTTAGFSGNVPTSGIRGTSPVRTSNGNSASPKTGPWQSNLTDFSLETPPNLRTSLADRPASYVRGSSPASRTSRGGRQSVTPTASRGFNSSHSQERDRLSSHSKGSIASSGDDDADSLQSAPLSVSDRPISRKGVGGYSSGRPSAYSKKPTKTISPSSAPKRLIDSTMRQMDRKSPQNMFRPLLSSVPSSTFYAGKVTFAHRSLMSRNSSVTTSSNASSDLAIGAHDTEDDGTCEYVRAPFSDIQDEVFSFEMDVANEHTAHEGHDTSNASDSREYGLHFLAMETVAPDGEDDLAKIDSRENLLLCSRCGSEYCFDELAENENNTCPQCKQNDMLSEISQNVTATLMNVLEESHVTKSTLALNYTDSKDISQTALHDENNTLEAEDQVSQLRGSCLENSLSISSGEESFQLHTKKQINGEDATLNVKEMPKYSDKTNRHNIMAEGAGISVLLNRSSSLKGHLVHGRTISSSAISYDDLSYARDLTSSVRSSIGHGSMSTTSSIDLTSARHGEIVVQRQMSGKRSDASSGTSTSLRVYQSFVLSMSSHDGSCEGSVSNLRHVVDGELPGSPSDHMELHDAVPSVSRAAMGGEDSNGICTSFSEKDTSFMADNIVGSDFEDKSRTSVGPDEGRVGHEFEEGLAKSIGNSRDLEEMAFIESSMAEENVVQDDRVDQGRAAEDPVQCSLSTMSEIEINDSHPSSPKSQFDVVSKEEFDDPSSTTHDEDIKHSSLKSTETDADGIAEESTVTVEEQEGRRTRSLTLEEATDTILFCNSIIHDLAYNAASIAIEKEKENLEPLVGSRPMITIPEKHSSERKDPIPRGVTGGKSKKAHKTRKRRATVDMDAKPPLTETESSNESVVRSVGLLNHGGSMKPPKLESKCNCTIM